MSTSHRQAPATPETDEVSVSAPWWERLVRLPLWLLLAWAASSCLGALWWPGVLAAQLGPVLVLAILVALVLYRHHPGSALCCWAVLACLAWPALRARVTVQAPPAAQGLQVFLCNAAYWNEQPVNEVAQAIVQAAQQAEVIVLVEATAELVQALRDSRAWPVWQSSFADHQRYGPYALALGYRSGEPGPSAVVLGPARRSAQLGMVWSGQCPLLSHKLTLGKQDIHLVAVHPPPPLTLAMREQQVQVIRRAVELLGEGPVILLGDFNATLRDPMWPQLTQRGFLDPAGPREPTWNLREIGPTRPWWGWQLDHVLVRGLAASHLSTTVIPGSDHSAVLVRVDLLPP